MGKQRRRLSDEASYTREVEEVEEHGPSAPGPHEERFPKRSDDDATGAPVDPGSAEDDEPDRDSGARD